MIGRLRPSFLTFLVLVVTPTALLVSPVETAKAQLSALRADFVNAKSGERTAKQTDARGKTRDSHAITNNRCPQYIALQRINTNQYEPLRATVHAAFAMHFEA